ncbi:MAG: DUF4835 family protein [Bacteroidota bacterium]|nr:DUF4835 family protein [Candidatus Kapabacteria bacterium]MDW8271639.1 DUF4835 family protein [Bacteroidota bacterium]
MSKILWFIALVIAVARVCLAQEFQPRVVVDVSMLSPELRQDVSTMQSDVLAYLQQQSFTGKEWQGPKIPIDVTIYLTGGNLATRRYTARLLYTSSINLDSGRTSPILRVLDQQWSFPYTLNQTLTFQSLRFDPFSTLIDFYNFIALGLDADSYEYLAGTPYYQRAQELCILGAANNAPGYSQVVQEPGELTRISLVTELLSPRFETFRKLIFDYHYDGINRFAWAPDSARATLEAILARMVTFKRQLTQASYLMRLFFDAKMNELCEVFRGTQNKRVLDMLRLLDPSNASVYEAAIEGR